MIFDRFSPVKEPNFLCGAVVSDVEGRILLTRTTPDEKEACWDVPMGPVSDPLDLAVVQLLDLKLGMLVWPVRVLCLAERMEAEGAPVVSIVYAATLLSQSPRGPSTGEPAKGWYFAHALPDRISPLALTAIGRSHSVAQRVRTSAGAGRATDCRPWPMRFPQGRRLTG